MNKSFLTNILIRILLIIAVAFFWGFAFNQKYYVASVITAVVLIILVFQLIQYQNKVNERIAYFFEAIKNEDYSQAFSGFKKDKILQDLKEHLTAVNQQIQEIKMETHQQEQYFRALIEHLGIGILTFNEQGFVVHVNNAFKNLLHIGQFTHIRQLERIDKVLYQAFKHLDDKNQQLISVKGKQGKSTLSVKASVFKNKNEKLTLLSVQDIRQELDEKELDSWMRLIRVLTHEIMNAIAPVTSLSESLNAYFKHDGQPIEPRKVNKKIIDNTIRGLEVIQEQGRGLISFVETYRKLTRLPKPEKQPILVGDLLSKMIMLNKSQNEAEAPKLSLQLKNEDLTILADEKLISQVLINLIKNAQEALQEVEQGEITLIAHKKQSGKIEICVKDNGPGIAKELQDEVFVPFFTTRENGNGIGLSLSRQIMRMHGGSLNVESEPYKETVFCMQFAENR